MDTPQPGEPAGRGRLADVLRGARQAKELSLSDVAERTNVRQEYLSALEEARYSDLPEDIYAKNFVRLYAQTVGVPVAQALELYSYERRGVSPSAVTSEVEDVSEEERPPRSTTPRRSRPGFAVGTWLPTLLLVAAVVALALWGFNNLLFQPARRAAPVADGAVTGSETGGVTGGATDVQVAPAEVSSDLTGTGGTLEGGTLENTTLPDASLSRFTLVTDPPGADVTLDGFPLPGTTPIDRQPLTPGVGRMLRVTLPGYETYEAPIDVSNDLRLSVTLTPVGTAAGAAGAEAEAESGGAAAVAGQLTVRIEDRTWLEAYASTQRGVGEQLVFTTVQPGETFTFDLPVYLHVGNAAGVLVSKDGQDLGAMGSSGEVVSRAYVP